MALVTSRTSFSRRSSELVDGLWSMPSDNAWNPHPPPGREQLLLYLQVDFNPLQNVSRRNEIFLIEFARPEKDE